MKVILRRKLRSLFVSEEELCCGLTPSEALDLVLQWNTKKFDPKNRSFAVRVPDDYKCFGIKELV